MVKKLFKYEFIYYIRTLGLFLLIIPVLGIMVRVFRLFEPLLIETTWGNIVSTLAIGSAGLLCYLGSLALLLTTTIVGIVRFYKNMFSAEGYLTFTLPVTNHQHIFVKLTALTAFELLSCVSILLGALVALSGDPLTMIFQSVQEIFAGIPPIHGIFYGLELFLLLAVSCVATPLLYYACISIGQTAKKNRILLAVGVYFLYYAITQAVATVAMILLIILGSLGAFDGLVLWIGNHFSAFLHMVFIVSTLFTAALGALYYFITYRVMTRKLNLE